MAKIFVKKKVNLAFLGTEYESSYIVFKALAVSEYDEISTKFDKATKKETVQIIVDLLKANFVEGKFFDGKELVELAADNITDLDEGTVAECFAYMIGQKLDPK